MAGWFPPFSFKINEKVTVILNKTVYICISLTSKTHKMTQTLATQKTLKVESIKNVDVRQALDNLCITEYAEIEFNWHTTTFIIKNITTEELKAVVDYTNNI